MGEPGGPKRPAGGTYGASAAAEGKGMSAARVVQIYNDHEKNHLRREREALADIREAKERVKNNIK